MGISKWEERDLRFSEYKTSFIQPTYKSCYISLRILKDLSKIETLTIIVVMRAATWQNQQNECAQQRLRSAWASAQSDQSLRYPHEESLGPSLPIESTAKTLIRLGGCPGWSESSLGAQSLCWFCHVAAHVILYKASQTKYWFVVIQLASNTKWCLVINEYQLQGSFREL